LSRNGNECKPLLVGKYGDDLNGMARDRKLNAMQHTVSQLRELVVSFVAYPEGEAGPATCHPPLATPPPVTPTPAAPPPVTPPLADPPAFASYLAALHLPLPPLAARPPVTPPLAAPPHHVIGGVLRGVPGGRGWAGQMLGAALSSKRIADIRFLS
jgi:hypothetical protein